MALVQEQLLEGAFGAAEPEHFRWQTEAPYVSDRERELVRRAFEPLGNNVLDLGCGEGATFLHLGREDHATGVDLFEEKLAFARRRLPKCKFVVGSAYELPFEDGSFDHLLIRDVIHHVAEPARLVDECARVLSPGGRIDVLEPCRNNPLIFLHALTNPAERGELRSTPSFLSALFARRFFLDAVERLQPLPVHRLVFHPKMGSPALAQKPAFARAVAAVEELAGSLLPEHVWAYIHVRASRRPESPLPVPPSGTAARLAPEARAIRLSFLFAQDLPCTKSRPSCSTTSRRTGRPIPSSTIAARSSAWSFASASTEVCACFPSAASRRRSRWATAQAQCCSPWAPGCGSCTAWISMPIQPSSTDCSRVTVARRRS